MTIDSWIFKEDDDKKKEKIKKKEIEAINKSLKENKKKEIDIHEKAEDNLFELKQMVDKWIFDKKTEELVEDIVNIDSISQSEIEEIFDKIDEIESTKDIDEILPKELRITKNDYKKSLIDDNYRTETIQKLNSSLSIIVNRIAPKWWVWMHIFWWFLLGLDKKLVKIQENSIDIKNSLKKVDEKTILEKKENLSFFQKILKFIKEIYKD